MDSTDRIDGYPSGPSATTEATALALAKLGAAAAVVLVEGVSDQIAVETAALGRGRDLEADRVVVAPIGGAHAIVRFLTSQQPWPAGVRTAGLCDRREADIFRRGMLATEVGSAGLYVCVEDLEDELIRAVGTPAVEALFEWQGDLGSFRSLQNQPAWRERALDAQMRRFLGSGARRKLRYARVLVQAAVDRDRLPRPLEALLEAI